MGGGPEVFVGVWENNRETFATMEIVLWIMDNRIEVTRTQ